MDMMDIRQYANYNRDAWRELDEALKRAAQIVSDDGNRLKKLEKEVSALRDAHGEHVRALESLRAISDRETSRAKSLQINDVDQVVVLDNKPNVSAVESKESAPASRAKDHITGEQAEAAAKPGDSDPADRGGTPVAEGQIAGGASAKQADPKSTASSKKGSTKDKKGKGGSTVDEGQLALDVTDRAAGEGGGDGATA